MDQTSIISFLGWAIIFHIAFLMVCAFLVLPFNRPLGRFAGALFGVRPEFASGWMFTYVAIYKLLAILCFFVSYLVLRLSM